MGSIDEHMFVVYATNQGLVEKGPTFYSDAKGSRGMRDCNVPYHVSMRSAKWDV